MSMLLDAGLLVQWKEATAWELKVASHKMRFNLFEYTSTHFTLIGRFVLTILLAMVDHPAKMSP